MLFLGKERPSVAKTSLQAIVQTGDRGNPPKQPNFRIHRGLCGTITAPPTTTIHSHSTCLRIGVARD